jgi:hypothetical protein
MSRTCTICTHDERHAINVALVQRDSYRDIARHYAVDKSALSRHAKEHLPELLVKAKNAVEVAEADDLLSRVEALQSHTLAILETAEETGELRTALSAIKEARSNLELVGRINKELDERPTLNLYMNPEWLELRAVIVGVLEPHREARAAVLRALESAGSNGGA